MKFFNTISGMRSLQKVFIKSSLLACLFGCSGAFADSVDSLSLFLKSTRSMRADFVQTVISPAKENRLAKSKTSSGKFAFVRPTVFRFDYTKPFVQNIVADGQYVWLYDADLNQVTQHNQSQALATTPASLIASANDVTSLQKEFVLIAQPDADGLQWVAATPHSSDSSLQRVRIGLRVRGHVGSKHALSIQAFRLQTFCLQYFWLQCCCLYYFFNDRQAHDLSLLCPKRRHCLGQCLTFYQCQRCARRVVRIQTS